MFVKGHWAGSTYGFHIRVKQTALHQSLNIVIYKWSSYNRYDLQPF